LTAETRTKTKRVVSGMRPTGRLHIGHYFGALQNWVRLQNDPDYDCFYFIADWHALTTHYAEDTALVPQNTIEITTDWLASGLDPDKSVLFMQSQIPEHAELHLLLSMVTPLEWLERVPTYKDQIQQLADKDLSTYGFLGYPLLQCADIVIYSEAGQELFVPVGEDQVPHVELSREVVRSFNSFYGFSVDYERWREENYDGLVSALFPHKSPGKIESANPAAHAKAPEMSREILRQQIREEGAINFAKRIGEANRRYFSIHEVLNEPAAMLTKTPRFPGLDGRRMAKSYGNAISLSESDADIRAKTKIMVTDPARKRRTDPGNPDVCPVYDWHKLFSPSDTLAWAAQGCRTAGIGCIECKSAMAGNLIKWIAPIRERRLEYEKHPARVLEIIDAGSKTARKHAQETMVRVREAVFGWDKKRGETAGDSAAKA
jgi:tryptophanyl-tRNA synthetase